MDPEGIREIFFAESSVGLEYGVRGAAASLPYLVRIKDSLSKGLHLPLTRPLPKRLDVSLQLSPGLHALDAIVLADIDPSTLDADDLWNLRAYVEAGGGLLLFAGPNAFNRAQRGWGPLAEALPIDIALQPVKKTTLWNDWVREAPKATHPVLPGAHPIARGLSGSLGQTKSWQHATLRASAAAVATAGDCPVVAAHAVGRGRVVTVAAFPDDAETPLFASPGWADLLRQALMWLFGRDDDLAILRCDADLAPLPHGDRRAFALEIDPAHGPFTASATVRRADPGWLAAGREPQYGAAEDYPAAIDGHRAVCAFLPPAPGRWLVRLAVAGDGWANAREFTVDAASASGLALSFRDGRYVFAPGWTLPLRVEANAPVDVELRLLDSDGTEVIPGGRGSVRAARHNPEPDENSAARSEPHPPADDGHLDYQIPDLDPGDYELVATGVGEEARLRFAVTDEVRRPGLTFVGPGGWGGSEAWVRRMHAYYREHGFNAICGAGGYREYLAQRDGMVLWGEYLGASLLKSHAHYGEEGSQATTPCVFDPAHAEALRDVLAERFRRLAAAPRMTYLEILDEPHLMRANVCHCDRCQAVYQARFGYPLPTWDEALAAGDRRTKDYFEWVVDYAGEAFRQGYAIWRSFGPGPGLTHVLCAAGSGNMSARHAIAEDLPWTPHADLIEFDCYNYMYPNWRGCAQLRWNEFHYLAGHFRFLCLRDGKPLGFYIQVTDRDAPVMPWDPVRAPSETLYTAVGMGAKTFHIMHQSGFSNKQNCREAKFDAFGEDILKVRRAAPVLERAQSPRRRVAMVFNFHDRLYRAPEPWLPEGHVGLGFYGGEHRPYDTIWPNHKSPINVAELLCRGFGETDVIDQRALHEDALADYGGFVLTGVDYLADEDARAIVRFVEAGGLLVCDHVPAHNTDGAPSAILAPLFTGEPRHFDREVTVARSAYGAGQTLCFSADLNELYTGAVERGETFLRDLLETTVRDFFDGGGLRPHARSADPEVEANVLHAPESMVLVAVNHAETRRQSRVTLDAPPVAVAAAVNLVTGRPYPIARTGDGVAVEVALDEREGLILALVPDLPEGIAVQAGGPLARGGRFTCTVTLTNADGAPARGDHIVELRVVDPAGREHPRYSARYCTSDGCLRLDAPLAVNAPAGPWTITAFDPVSRRVAAATVEVE